MSSYHRTDDELRSITFGDDDAARDDHVRRSTTGVFDGRSDYYDDDPPPPPSGPASLPDPPTPRRRPSKSKTKTALLVLLSLVLMLGGGLVLGVYLMSENLLGQVSREDTFGGIPEDQRAPEATTEAGRNSINILLAGLDGRDDAQTTGEDAGEEWTRGGQRSDTMMIMHISADRGEAYLISVPRDAWVDIPGRGMDKMTHAYAYGGSELYVRTIEQLTNLRIDHYTAIDMKGFVSLTDALGGVEMTFESPVQTASGATIPAGTSRLSGVEALDYVRERKSLSEGDFDRVRRQQNFLRSLMRQALSADLLGNPTGAISSITSNLSVDQQFTNDRMRSLAFELRNLRPNKIEFITAPVNQEQSTGSERGMSVVYLDMDKVTGFFEAVKEDQTAQWLAENSADTLAEQVR